MAGRQPSVDLLGQDGPMRPHHPHVVRRTAGAVVAGVTAALLAGCTGGPGPGESDDPPAAASPTPSAEPSRTPAPAPPEVGGCHRLTLAEATAPVDTTGPVGCRTRHTAVTVAVGRLPLLASGHLLAVDSRQVRQRVADACPPSLLRRAGGDETTRRLSRLRVVWFTPSLEQADAGADRYRCDLVAVRDEDRLLPLPARVTGLLDRPRSLDTFGTCGTAAPDARGFRRIACADPHRWRAVDTVDLPRAARHLDPAVTRRGKAACEDVAAARADGELRYSWAFEWPTRAQWREGQRWGWCWVPRA